MARNEEKQIAELNRFVLAAEKDRVHESSRPSLDKLTTADAIRRWIPRIKGDMDYCVQQIEGSRNYTDVKINEFKMRLSELQLEYEAFVKKAIELDPNPMWLPGERHSYVSKKSFSEALTSRKAGETMVNFNDANGSRHSQVAKKKTHIPEYLQPVLQRKTEELRKEEPSQTTSEDDSSSSSDEEIPTPLATLSKRDVIKESHEDKVAAQNKSSLNRGFNSSCILYSIKRGFHVCYNK